MQHSEKSQTESIVVTTASNRIGTALRQDPTNHRCRPKWAFIRVLLTVWLGSTFFVGTAVDSAYAEEPTTAQIAATRSALQDAARLYQRGEYDRAADLIGRVRERLNSWTPSADKAIQRQVESFGAAADRAAVALTRRGIAITQPTALPQARSTKRPASRPRAAADAAMLDALAKPVSFATQIAPLLAESCLECHNTNDRSAGLSVQNYASLQRGGNNGGLLGGMAAIESLLVRKLKGTADGQQMPLDGQPWQSQQIALVERWLREGGVNDVGDELTPIAALASHARLASASADEISFERRVLAKENWGLAFPTREFKTVETDNFLVVGNTETDQLTRDGVVVEQTWERIRRALKLEDELRLSGRVTVFCVDRIFDLNEFAMMVEGRSLPRPPRPFIAGTVSADAYVVLVRNDSELPAGPLVHAITAVGVKLSMPPDVPPWFSEGTACAMELRLSRATASAKRRAVSLNEAARLLENPSDFIQQRTTASLADQAAASFLLSLMRSPSQFAKLLGNLQSGTRLPQAVSAAYGLSQEQLLLDWWQEIGGRPIAARPTNSNRRQRP